MIIFAKSLSNKEIISQDGRMIGHLYNLTVDSDTGDIIDLVVQPNKTLNTKKYRVDGDLILIPFKAVKSIKEYIIVDTMLV
ncbi:MAG: PRC-barrel domain containing protein [Candidatus Methanoliparum thermophilum]|uniref:PRC-barrel domain containing protein n=1 Tax=Methanoliparum thermophilum TaxID=2491083 RepID=A0A520KSZ9_METT2|nr:PRC-barrel domain-containing protein [Candidatus Methanoliparum sp. LAM-1]RZN64870.1 MAG: PRC-barrel domain containing protein [Candidatus Methanoliparum thermophilum]BDC36257.1 photosystem reaction center subunit H [Candidatus Methanoliparum sp. LAM-1]